MESTRPIRALTRGLDALTVLNLRDGATVSEVAREIRLPRTTVYRILETLCDAGFVFRDAADERYRLTLLVRGLSNGFDDERWVTQIVTPLIHELGRDLVWPVSVATLSGTSMMLREATDHHTPLAIERYSVGCRTPLLGSAAGLAYLAFCPPAQRETLMEGLAPGQRGELQRVLADIQAQGYATATRTRRLVDEVNVSVPVISDGGVLAVLTVRFMASAVSLKAGLERFLPKLRQCAASISHSFTQQRLSVEAAALS
ncbi:MAG: helix-turn-helix domain-containing protein [Pseudomonadota bacterium]|nr:helix-turn-helix domain-containing protein [Pseudomonadota bacterium]